MASASSLLLDELYDAGDPRFLDEVLASTAARKLRALADRRYGDARPFAREALLRYLDDGCDWPHHRPLVKALFKLAEMAADDEAMGHFLVAFDWPRRRRLKPKRRGQPLPPVFRHDPTVPLVLGIGGARAPLLAAHAALPGAPHVPLLPHRRPPRRDPLRADSSALRSSSTRIATWRRPSSSSTPGVWSTRSTGDRPSSCGSRAASASRRGAPWPSSRPRPSRLRRGRGRSTACSIWWSGRGAARCAPSPSPCCGGTMRMRGRGMPLARVRGLLRSPHDEVQVFAAEVLQSTRGAAQLTVDEWLRAARD